MEERSEHLLQRLKEAVDDMNQLRETLTEFSQRIETAAPDEIASAAEDFSGRLNEILGTLQPDLEDAMSLSQELREQLESAGEQQAVKTDNLAQSFRSMIENIQNQARQRREGIAAATLKSVDVELKGLIVVEEDEARVITPTLSQAIDPATLSTIRMSFGSIPVLQTPEREPEEPEEDVRSEPRTRP
jgi:gas vesicle protein